MIIKVFKKFLLNLNNRKAEEATQKNYLGLYKVHKMSETLLDEIKKNVLRSFPIGSTVTELGTGKEMIIESYDIDKLLLKVVEPETGIKRLFDYKNSLEWNTFYFTQESK